MGQYRTRPALPGVFATLKKLCSSDDVKRENDRDAEQAKTCESEEIVGNVHQRNTGFFMDEFDKGTGQRQQTRHGATPRKPQTFAAN
jgi:hypothetical protein